MIGLLLIAIGTGGIKPCVSAFGGDQFEAGEVCFELSNLLKCFETLLHVSIFPPHKLIPCRS